MVDQDKRINAPFASMARFGPGSIIIFSLLAVCAIALVLLRIDYLALVVGLLLIVIFFVKTAEVIRLSAPVERQIVGMRCLVMKQVGTNERGIVRVYRSNGELDPELWSAELANSLGSVNAINEGEIARVVTMKSIILQIEPIEKSNL